MEQLVANLSMKATRKQLAGRSYLVAPVVMILEGVFAGNQGPLFYSGKEIAKAVQGWNHKPITIGHPTDSQGVYISGCDTGALERFAVGMILNTRWESKGKRLKAEAWFDETRLNQVEGGAKILDALTMNTPLEVSTGLIVDNRLATGQHEGREYKGEAINHRPDHLAVILQGVGACSLRDGAGLLVNKGDTPLSLEQLIFVECSKSEANDCVLAVNRDKQEVLYRKDNAYFAENFTIDGESAKLLGQRIQVDPTCFLANERATQVSKDKLAQALGEVHAEFVANLSESQVEAILALEKTVEVEKVIEKVIEVPVTNAPKSLDEALAPLPDALKNTVREALAVNADHRKSMVDKILANPANQFSADELASFTTATLSKMGSLAVNSQAPAPKYAGSPGTGNSGAPQVKGFLPPSSFVPAKG